MEISIDDTVLNGDTEQWLVQFVTEVLQSAGITEHDTMRIYDYSGKRVYLIADGHEIDDCVGDYTIRTWNYKKTPESEKKLEGREYNANKDGTPEGEIELTERVEWTLYKRFLLGEKYPGQSAGTELAVGDTFITFKVNI